MKKKFCLENEICHDFKFKNDLIKIVNFEFQIIAIINLDLGVKSRLNVAGGGGKVCGIFKEPKMIF